MFVVAPLRELVGVLEGQARERDRLRQAGTMCPWVFHREGAPIRFFRDEWTRACRVAGQPGRIPHDLRRTAVRNLVRAGVSEKVAMLMTGHKTRSVFDRYHIVVEEDIRIAAEKLATVRFLRLKSEDFPLRVQAARSSRHWPYVPPS